MMIFSKILNPVFFAAAAFILLTAGAGELPSEAFSVLEIEARAYPDPGKILVSVDVMGTAADNTREDFMLTGRFKSESPEAAQPRAFRFTGPGMREELVFDAEQLLPGDYEIEVQLKQGRNTIQTSVAELYWPGRSGKFKDVRVLNNYVWELLSVESGDGKEISGTYSFNAPVDRWLFVRTISKPFEEGRVSVFLGKEGNKEKLHEHFRGAKPVSMEAMREAGAGEHRIRIEIEGEGAIDMLQVRSVPEIQHHRFPSAQYGEPGVDYSDWQWLNRHMLPHVNTIIAGYGAPPRIDSQIREWLDRGGKWLVYSSRPATGGQPELEETPEQIYDYFRNRPPYSHPKMGGVLMDELIPRYMDAHENIAAAIRMLNTDPELEGRSFYPYVAQNVSIEDEHFIDVTRAAIEGGGLMAWESYIYSRPTYSQAINAMRRDLDRQIIPCKEKLPGVIYNSLWVFGSFAYPHLQADGFANANYNAFLDLQFQMTATHPALFGLGGVSTWRTGYQDEEMTRLFGKMFRHYCIEGNTGRMRHDPYLLTHIKNPGFSKGLEGWMIEQSSANAFEAREIENFGKSITGWWQAGEDSFLVIERSREEPNIISQEIAGLEEGALYSVKMFTGNYDSLVEGDSSRETTPISLHIEGAVMLEGPRYSYQLPFARRVSSEFMGFTRENPFWLNYHWQVFRAEGTSARLLIRDRKEQAGPGPDQGGRFFCAHVEVKPYVDAGY